MLMKRKTSEWVPLKEGLEVRELLLLLALKMYATVLREGSQKTMWPASLANSGG